MNGKIDGVLVDICRRGRRVLDGVIVPFIRHDEGVILSYKIVPYRGQRPDLVSLHYTFIFNRYTHPTEWEQSAVLARADPLVRAAAPLTMEVDAHTLCNRYGLAKYLAGGYIQKPVHFSAPEDLDVPYLTSVAD